MIVSIQYYNLGHLANALIQSNVQRCLEVSINEYIDTGSSKYINTGY